jgi:succinate dehydrogenase/fumarate reductase flavoprotein subunit
MAVGEAACVSVHGANRLGSNSLIDLVVFGRAAALRCAESLKPGAAQPELPKDAGDAALARLDRFRNAKGGTPTAELRWRCRRRCRTIARCSAPARRSPKAQAHPRRSGRHRRHRRSPTAR